MLFYASEYERKAFCADTNMIFFFFQNNIFTINFIICIDI